MVVTIYTLKGKEDMKNFNVDFEPDEFGPEKVIIVYDSLTKM